jgi:hypothetical protein
MSQGFKMKNAEMIRIKHTTLPWGYPNINMWNRRVQLFFWYNKNNTVKHTSQSVNLDFPDCIFPTNIQKKKVGDKFFLIIQSI